MSLENNQRSPAGALSRLDSAIREGGCNRADSVVNKSHSRVPTARKRTTTKEFLEANIQRLTAKQKQRLAQRLGYESIDNVIASSTVVRLSDGSSWWLTVDLIGRRTAWNLCAISLPTREPRLNFPHSHRRSRNVGGPHTRRPAE
jgi:hypothetical protein